MRFQRVRYSVFLALFAIGGSHAATISAIKAAASENQAVTVSGTVTALSGWKNSFFIQDETGSISVDRLDGSQVQTGDRVEVAGTLRPGLFAPLILSRSVSVRARGVALPQAAAPAYEELVTGRFDSRRIAIRGIVHSARIETVWGRQILMLNLAVPGGSISVHVLDYSGINSDLLVDSTVSVRGVCGTKFNDRQQIIGLRLFVPSLSDVKIESRAPDPAGIKVSDISQVQRYSLWNGSQHRVKMAGTLTYQSEEHGLYLEENGSAIHLQTDQPDTFSPGDRLEALGYLHNFGYSPGLQDAQVRRIGSGKAVRPLSIEAAKVITIKDGFRTTPYDGLLVRMTATVLEQIPNSENQVWLLRQGDVAFQAELAGVGARNMATFESKSTVTIVGVCLTEVNDNGSPTSFRILLRSPQDILVAESPYSREAILLLGLSLVVLLCGGLALWHFERIFAAETAPGMASIRLKSFAAHFEAMSRTLPWLVIALALLSLAVDPKIFLAQEYFAGSPVIRFAVLLASLAVLWSGGATKWKQKASVLCLVCAALIACNPMWQSRNTPAVIALAFFTLCLGLLLQNRRLIPLAQMLFVSVAVLSMMNVVTRFYNASPIYGVARHTTIPPLLAACLFMLSGAALCSRASSGFMKTVSSANLGGVLSRTLLPAALLIPVLLGWLRLQGQLAGLYDTLWGLALFAMANVVSFSCVIWATSAVLNRLDTAREGVTESLRERDVRLELLFEKSGIGDYTWNIQEDSIRFHPMIRRLYGAEEADETDRAEWFRTRQHPDDAAKIAEALQNAIANKKPLDIEFRIVLPDGGIRWICCRGNVVYDAAGIPTHIHGLNIDITDRKSSEAAVNKGIEAVREADEQLRTALEFSKVPVWRWITWTNEIRWSGPVESVYGKPASELSTFAQFRDLVHPDDLADLDIKLSHSLRTGSEYQAQFRILVAGGIRWLAGRGNTLRDGSGQVYGMSGINFDITAIKTAQQRLVESERNFRELADAMPQIVWTSDAEGKATYFNRQWDTYTGKSGLEGGYQFIHPDDREEVRRAWQSAVLLAVPFQYELRLRRASDDSYRWHLSRALPVTDENGQTVQWFGTSTDIEDFKQLNTNLERRVEERSAELAESELRYRLLVEGVKDYAILLLDPQGLVKSWNEGAELLTGYRAAEILGRNFATFYTAASVSAGEPQQSLRQAAGNGRSQHEGWRVRQNGDEFWAGSVTTALRDAEGELYGFSKVIRDMTEQRRVEALLISERKRAESANHAKSAFLASMSHEIRTPMNAILGMADMLWESELSQSQRHYVEIFRRAGGNLLTLINDILDLSKIESGNFTLEEVDFDVTALIEQVIEILNSKAESKSIGLRAQLAFASAPTVVGDPVRLQQILLNLIGNAIKFTEKGDVVVRVQCRTEESYARLEFEVCDSGIGIPSDKLEAIFDDFEQAETSTTRRFGGTGLGLGISRRLVRRMRGEIQARSELGKGSTFSFHVILPVGRDQTDSDSMHLDDIGGKSVLIVDNNSTNRVILSEMCSAWGMAVTTCSSGREAIEAVVATLQKQPFALALIDRLMPGMDGFETANQIRSLNPATAVFIVSSDSQTGDIARCRELGLAGHLMKPVRRAELLEQVVRALGRKALPLASDAGPVPFKDTVRPGRRFRILAAEDSEDNRFIIQAYCQGSLFDLIFVEDGQKAVEAFQTGSPFDLIIMDVQMPVKDGLTATREIRDLEATGSAGRTPILALTANALAEDVKRARAAGCDAHLSKPISKKTFLSELEHWLAKSLVPADGAPLFEIPKGLEELAPNYLAARKREISAFRELAERSDFQELRLLSHNLKGTGTSYGFPDITRLGAAIEQASKDCNLVDIAQQISALAAYVDAASELLGQRL